MKKSSLTWFFLVAVLLFASPALAALRVVATTPALAAVAKAVGGAETRVTSLALHTQDPHWVDARPHLALDLAQADLLLLTGAELEVGWLPTLLTGSRNGAIQKGARGYLDCSELVVLLDVPKGKVDRSQGDIHPQGNPHYMLDPREVERAAVGIGKRLAALDPQKKNAYFDNTKRFVTELRRAEKRWEEKLAPHRGQSIVAYHRSMPYLAAWLGLKVIEHIEPRPGIPPNPRHVAHVVQAVKQAKVRVILQESWYADATSRLIASKCAARVVQIPGMPDFAKGETYIAYMSRVVDKLDAGFKGG